MEMTKPSRSHFTTRTLSLTQAAAFRHNHRGTGKGGKRKGLSISGVGGQRLN